MEFATHAGLLANLNFKSFEQVPWNSDHEQSNWGNTMNSEFIKHEVDLIIKVSWGNKGRTDLTPTSLMLPKTL